MIEAVNLTKRFDDIVAVDHISATIRDGSVFGLIGTNGAGKSTFLRLASGVLKPDQGCITIDGHEVFENIPAKKRFFYISDEQYFFNSKVYQGFDEARFHKLMGNFGLDEKRKIHTFSKGMKKQVSVICGVCAGTDYLFCDETFDGLDPVMRQAVKSLFAADMADRNLTPIIASHNLRELEDVCDHVGILSRGKVLIERSLSALQENVVKMQVVFQEKELPQLPGDLQVLHVSQVGRIHTLIIRGNATEITNRLAAFAPILMEALPLTLEEIFIYELGGEDYAVRDIVL